MRSLINVLCGVLIVSLGARVSFDIPYSEINITGQTLTLLIVGFWLKPIESVHTILLYLVLGVLGFPLFSEGNSGWKYFTGASLGYFIGFFFAICFIAYLKMKAYVERNSSFLRILVIHVLATLIILLSGALFLSFDIGVMASIKNGVIPFLLGGMIKSILGSIIVVKILKISFHKDSIAEANKK